MRADTDPDGFLSEGFQLRDELIDLGELVSNEGLTSIILDALPEGKCLTIKVQSRDPNLGLEEIINMVIIFLLKGRQLQKWVKSRIVKVVITVVNQQRMVENQ